MPKINRIAYSCMNVSLVDTHGNIRVIFSYAGWQKWLIENGSVTIPFIFNTKSKKAQFIQ